MSLRNRVISLATEAAKAAAKDMLIARSTQVDNGNYTGATVQSIDSENNTATCLLEDGVTTVTAVLGFQSHFVNEVVNIVGGRII